MSVCPYCPDFECEGTFLEIAHMNACHPEIIAERLAEIGEDVPDPFEGHGVKQVISRQALLIITMAAISLDQEPEIIVFPTEVPKNPWVSFNLGDRKFGIWMATLHLYEADEHGAMGTDIIDPAMVPKIRSDE
jgi:hypothetical protein